MKDDKVLERNKKKTRNFKIVSSNYNEKLQK